MFNGNFFIPVPKNEPGLSYAPGTKERAQIKAALREMSGSPVEVPMIIGGKEVKSGTLTPMKCPHNLSMNLGQYHQGNIEHAAQAIEAAMEAHKEWAETPEDVRASILLRAAELLSTKYRMVVNAATMLNMSKTCHQAEIDSACELIDFWRFNPYYMQRIYADQPYCSTGVVNYVEQRPLEGFVFAVTPFNFASIAGNLPTSPALMGNTVVWKPASSAVLPAYYIMKCLMEAGMPPGVINMIPGRGSAVGPSILEHRNLGGVHFTGSTAVFADIWKTIGNDVIRYISYPRIVGETGGKDFVFAHVSADVAVLSTGLLRGAFEYQGQKCSAASRAYIPDSIWPKLKERFTADVSAIKMGDTGDFENFMGAVIDEKAFKTITGYIDYAKNTPGFEIITGGNYDKKKGYFIEPTAIVSKDPKSRLMSEEIFGPVLTIYVYPEKKFEETLHVCDETSLYALTGSIFAEDRRAIETARRILRNAAGNFYINDKPTGAVVGQQPFGGARASGTNDKAGSALNLSRWVSPRTIKETFVPPTDFRYPFMAKE